MFTESFPQLTTSLFTDESETLLAICLELPIDCTSHPYKVSVSASTARPASPSLFQFVRKLRSPQGNSRTTVTQLSVAGTLYSDPVDVADALNEQFIGFGTQDDPSWNVPDFKPPDAPSRGRTTPTLQDVTTTPFAVAKQILNLKTRKAAGADGISHELLKLFCPSIAYPLSLIFKLLQLVLSLLFGNTQL